MKKHIVLIGGILLFALSLQAQKDSIPKTSSQTDTIIQRIVLIGDAGQLTNGRHPVVDAVKKLVKLDKKTLVLFMGDNLYRTGLPDSQALSYRAMRAVLDSQLSVIDSTDAKLLMIPGNHDWLNGGRGGFEAEMREQLYVNFLGKKNVRFEPQDGCPGPFLLDLGEVAIIAFDSQWWLHPHDKPGIESDCNCKTTDELVTQIQELATKNSKKLVILADHHPFKSNGPHGGYYSFTQHLFPFTDFKANLYIPLPIIGSIYPISRSVFGTPQDLKFPVYQTMVNEITEALKAVPNLIFVAGHDHNLQHIKDSSRNYIISGGGSKTNRTSKPKNSLYSNRNTGFAVLEISVNKNVTLDFYEVTDTSAKKDYTAFLLNFSKIPEEKIDTNAIKLADPFLKYKDTVTVAPSNDYPPIGGLKKLFMGDNYRKEWMTPVNMKIFNINKERGGFDIVGLGGGGQTKTLQLKERGSKKEWILRSLEKDPKASIPEEFRGNLAKELVTELKSSSHPYGALTFPILSKALDINVAHPQLFFVPDDPALGFYRPYFGGYVCMLEEKDASWNREKTLTTGKVIDKMLDENDHRPAEAMVLQARLLDILTADFDRHFDQWRWGSIDTGKGKVYYPIPRDRDEAYFYSDGFTLRFASNRVMPFLKGFRSTIPKAKWLAYSARDFDRIFMITLDKAAWKAKIEDFQQRLPDSVIRRAMQQLPKEIYAIDGETMIKKLISRRDLMMNAGLNYYRYLSKTVNVLGSNQKEYFKVNNDGKGLHVKVYARSKGNDTSFVMFDRVFNRSETKEVRLYGLNDNDIFDIEPGTTSKVKLRIIGGRGNDTFDIRGNVVNLLYDISDSTIESNYIRNNSRSKNRFEPDPPVNERSINGYRYNENRYPRFHLNYNSDDGLMTGVGFSRRTYGFRNQPYASDHQLSFLYNLDHTAYQIDYKGIVNHITRNYDLLMNFNLSQPDLQTFTGFGNNTKLLPGKDFGYYLTRYRSFEAGMLFRKRFFDNAHVMFGPYFFHYNNKYSENKNTVLGTLQGVDSSNTFRPKNYGGFKVDLLIDNRNREFYPTRGVHWLTEITALKGITGGSRDYIKYTTDMQLYASLKEAAKIVAVLRWGGGKIYTKRPEFFQALSLGANNDLSGFRKNRFNGSSLMYAGLELKYKLLDVNSYILPGTLGITAFTDGGRVWNKDRGEHSRTWHMAYGIGIFYLPFNVVSISATVGFWGKEQMTIFNFGTKINLIW